MPTRQIVCRFPASLQYLTALRHFVHAFCVDTLGADAHDEQVYQLQLAVSELATNIIVHAYRDRELGSVDVTGEGGDGVVTLEFWDTGKAYVRKPPVLPELERLAEGGYGSFIIQQCVDVVTYERDGERNHWRLEKHFGNSGGE
ncbi:MAG: ATP-binding protein [Thermomicrobiales bacterium]